MASGRSVVLELNEICPSIVATLIAADAVPNMAALRRRSLALRTEANDADLEPWVQWPTFHAGRPQSVHGLTELDQGHRSDLPAWWADAAERAVVFGAMNLPAQRDDAVHLPDYWASKVPASSAALRSLHQVVSRAVAEHANPDAKPSAPELVRLAAYLARTGGAPGLAWDVAKQLLSEASVPSKSWRRAIILDELMWLAFARTVRERKADLGLYFANSAAYLQHRYWKEWEPEAYETPADPERLSAYADAIPEAYRRLDRVVGKAVRLAGPDGHVVIVSALSQQANTAYDAAGGRLVHRARDFSKLGAFAGLGSGVTFQPVMTHQAWLTTTDEAEAEAALRAMTALRCDGRPAAEGRRDSNRALFWCAVEGEVPPDATVSNGDATVPFGSLFAPVGLVNASKHHPEGVLWIAGPGVEAAQIAEPVPLEDAGALIRSKIGLRAAP